MWQLRKTTQILSPFSELFITYHPSSQDPLGQIGPNLDMILLGVVSGDLALHPRWLPRLLKNGNLKKSSFSEPLNGLKTKFHPNCPFVAPFPSNFLSVDPISYQRWLPQFIMQLLVFLCCSFWHKILLIFFITFRLMKYWPNMILRYLSLSFQNFYLSSIASILTF